ncbi:Uma2 family endonuclease [Nocardia sp. NPDC004068]|uniref:Uma2 family endonuclease n=1 Tax=Nocardia sp. NPDC004068 TaxID=3364303 RepID=UPI003690DC9F
MFMPEMAAVFPPVLGRWTAADLDRIPENGLRYEVLNGQLVVSPAPTPLHQKLLTGLFAVLETAAPQSFWVLPGVGVLSGEDEPIPDLIVGRGRVDMDATGIPADQVLLAVEIVSPPTSLQDRLVKPLLYAQARIANYWRIETGPFEGHRPGEQPPVLFAHALARGRYELTHRVAAGRPVTLGSPFAVTLDPATLLR